MADILSKSEDLWSSYKNLKKTIWKYLCEDSDDTYAPEFESTLRKHKQNFFSLLQNQPKNAKSREELKKGMVDGIVIKGLGHQVLSKELYQEAVILSDMYDMNEFVALDLLCTAQIQMSYYPGLPRGLVAVLLYYDGRKALVSSLRYLVQARSGVQWSLSVKPDVERFVTMYTDQLMEGGLFNRILDLLKTLDLSKELEKLQENLALGGARHRRQVTDLFQDIRVVLADVVFTWAAQSGLPTGPTLALINHLRQAQIEEEASGNMDVVTLYLQMALLSALDLSVLHSREDGEEAVQSLPILSDADYVNSVMNELMPTKPKWKCEGLQATSTFGLAVCIASLRLVPQNQRFQEVVNKEEIFIDAAIEMNVFEFIHNIILDNEVLYKEQFLFKRMHHLITDFIVYMYPKVKELRIKADEIARTVQIYAREGLDAPPNLPRYFEYLLLTIAKFYSKDQLGTEYVLNYWSPVEIQSTHGSQRVSPRAVSLFKFVRLAGDMLPSTLFVPYLKMLSSLSSCPQAARHCFNMLKQVGPQLTSTLSWDHFFMSFAQYYNNLRQEMPLSSDTVYRNTFLKGVSPQELEGLHAVLLLIRTIADHDEFTRLALCEHPGWAPLSILLGLVGCSVPIPLKAELLLTLASLSKSSENAAQMWENLEASQILVTVPTTSSYTPRGIQTELDEVESRMEEYPLTRAFLKLLDVLTDFGIPRTLGAGPRKPGFDPYLSFIVSSVFLKFHTRSYRSASEKWEVADSCLKLFEKFLAQYDPQIADFPRKNTAGEFNSPPGYHLMILMNNKSELLNVILDIVDEGNRLFDTYVAFPGQKLVEECTSRCLNIIHSVLALQSRFFDVLTRSSASILLTSLTKLLLTINRRSGKPDHCLNIAKYISYQPYLLKHSLVVVKILIHVTSTPLVHNQFIKILLASDVKDEIKHGFVLCLDAEIEENDVDNVLRKTKLEVLKLLKECLQYNAPNFSHLLLGFDLKRDISKTEFQYSGVLDFPRSCLHCVTSLVEAEVVKETETISTSLLESAYELIFLLASNGKTYGPVLRFLRLNKGFFINHLTLCTKRINNNVHVMNQVTWLLKTLAVELKVASQGKQVSYLKQLTNFLVSLPQLEGDTNQDPFSATYKDDSTESSNYMFLDRLSNNFMISLIPHFEFSADDVQMPTWQFFDGKVLSALIDSCVVDKGAKLINLKKLHQRLYDELKLLQGTAVMGQIQAVTQEIPKVMKYALELNKNKERHSAIVQFVDAWRQVTQILVVFIPIEVLGPKESQLMSICFVLSLLKKVVKVELITEVARLLSGAVLLIFENIRKCHSVETRQQRITGDATEASILHVHLGSLKEILENLIEWIMVSNVTDEKLRVNLYAALVTILELSSLEESHDNVLSDSMYVSRLDSSRVQVETAKEKLKISMDVLSKFGERLVEIMCQDCIGGYEVSKMLALSSFSVLITLSGNVNWIVYMSGRGYLKYIIESILESNDDLERLLEPGPASIKPLYVYMSKMLFLGRLAGTRVGAELLLEQKIFACLGNMNVFSYHPEISRLWRRTDILENFIPPPEELYLQIWLPTLHICNAILTTLGTDNQSAVVQIVYFILSHLDTVELILRSASPSLSLSCLDELSLLTSVIARTANNDLINILERPDVVHTNRAHVYRIQKLTLALLPRFILTDSVVKDLVTDCTTERVHTFQTSDRLLYAMQIMSNLLTYCRNVVANHDVKHGGVGVIFQPTLSDPALYSSSTTSTAMTKTHFNLNDQTTPSLGVVVQQLISAVNYHHHEKFTYDLLNRKVQEISTMDNADLDEFLDETMCLQDVFKKREHIFDLMSDRLAKKRKEMEYCSFIIENAIYLIWVHLDYYMLKAIPKVKNFGTPSKLNASMVPNTLASTLEATWKVSTDDISNLKHGLVSIFNDSFTKQLLESIQDQNDLDKGFVETLLRKILRLIQFVPVK